MFKVGIDTEDITPKTPQYMCGYVMRTEKSKGVHNDLTVTALSLNVNDKTMVLISADIIMIDSEITNCVKEEISSKYLVEKNMISIGGMHTHSAPVINNAIDDEEKLDKDYKAFIISQIITAAEKSIEKMEAGDRVLYRYGKIEGIYGNRNDKNQEGDKLIHIIEFLSGNTLIASIVNFSCHGTVLGPDNYIISADLPGEIRRCFKEKTGITPLLMNGNAGDMGNRQYRKGNDINELQRVGSELKEQLLSFTEYKEIKLDDIICEEVNFNISYNIKRDELKRQIKDSQDKLSKEENYDKIKLLKSGIAFLTERMNRENAHVDINIHSFVYKIGDLAIVTIPGELFSKLGLWLKKESSYKPTLIFGYANEFSGGYLVNEEDYNEGYESITTEIPKGKPEELVRKIAEHLKG